MQKHLSYPTARALHDAGCRFGPATEKAYLRIINCEQRESVRLEDNGTIDLLLDVQKQNQRIVLMERVAAPDLTELLSALPAPANGSTYLTIHREGEPAGEPVWCLYYDDVTGHLAEPFVKHPQAVEAAGLLLLAVVKRVKLAAQN